MNDSSSIEPVFSEDGEDDTGQHLEQLLAKLATIDIPINNYSIFLIALRYLYLLWAYFEVQQIEPADEQDDSGKGGKTGIKAILPVGNNWSIYDYGKYLSASSGEHYGSYSTGKLIEAAKKIIDLLAKRGAKKVNIFGHYVARRAAWLACQEHGIEIANYSPNEDDMKAFGWIKYLQVASAKNAPLLPEAQPK